MATVIQIPEEQLPAAIHTAFNPIIIKANDIDYDKFSVRITTPDNKDLVLLEKDILNKKLVIDLSSVIKSLLDDTVEETEIFYNGERIINLHHYLFEHYKFYITLTRTRNRQEEVLKETVPRERLALNAVSQIRQGNKLSDWQGKFLTTAKTIKKYKDYPLELAVLNYKGKNAIVYFNKIPIISEVNETTLTAKTIGYPHFVISVPNGINRVTVANGKLFEYLETNNNIIITTNAAEAIIIQEYAGVLHDNKTFPKPCGYGSPFYVRWVNRIAGYDYFMFDFRQRYSKEIKGIKTYAPNYENQAVISGYEIPIAAEATETVTVGASGLNNDDYEMVSNLVYSPKIEWYDKEREAWVRLQVNKSKLEKDSRLHSQSVEFDFLLPEIQLQY